MESPRSTSASPSRRRVLTGVIAGAGLLGAGWAASGRILAEATAPDPVRSVTAAFTSADQRSALTEAQARSLPQDSRVLPALSGLDPELRQREFLLVSSPWIESLPARHRSLAVSALLDLWVLTDSLPATVASWSTHWRYVWPRDAAFVAVALGRVGHVAAAWNHLLHLQSLQGADGSFAARYLTEGNRTPDDRASQFDSVGLVVWAVSEVHAAARAQERDLERAQERDLDQMTPTDELRAEVQAGADDQMRVGERIHLSDRNPIGPQVPGEPIVLEAMAPLLVRSSDILTVRTAAGTRLPPPSSDYWEVVESRVTLGIAAPTLVGLHHLAELASRRPDLAKSLPGGAQAAVGAAQAFRGTFDRMFTATGLQRYPTTGGLDSAVAYLPATGVDVGIDAAVLDGVWKTLEQPAGGIRPGEGWHFDRASWTPSTSLMGLAYARVGARAQAEGILDWLSRHRTSAGSLPEKIAGDGSGASVAPLSWTAANVILSLDELYRPRDSVPPGMGPGDG